MMEKKLYTINEIIKDIGIARSTFDKFAETDNLRPVKTEKRGRKLYLLKDKGFIASHYVDGKGKEEKKKFISHKAERHDGIVDLLHEQVQQLKKASEQFVHGNNILIDQLRVKNSQIATTHRLTDQT